MAQTSSPVPMPRLPRTPEQAHDLFVEFFNAGDLEGLVALYETDAVLCADPEGQPARGRQAIREALAGFLALKGTITVETRLAVQSGNIALLRSHWSVAGTGPDALVEAWQKACRRMFTELSGDLQKAPAVVETSSAK